MALGTRLGGGNRGFQKQRKTVNHSRGVTALYRDGYNCNWSVGCDVIDLRENQRKGAKK